jgi:cell wall-associated NlpC family hydrolase
LKFIYIQEGADKTQHEKEFKIDRFCPVGHTFVRHRRFRVGGLGTGKYRSFFAVRRSCQAEANVQLDEAAQPSEADAGILVQAEEETGAAGSDETETAASVEITDINYAAGTALVTIKGIEPSDDVKRVTVPVWSREGQTDINWYEASYKDGAYCVTVDLAYHKYNAGVYNVHAYYEDASAALHFINSTTVDFSAKNASVSVQKTSSGYKASVSGISVPAGITGVTFPVWSEEGGQDDIKWFNGSYNASDGTASVEYKTSDFSSFGKYFAHVYGTNRAGSLVYLGETEYTVNAPAAESVEVSVDNSTGKFTVRITGVTSDSGISKIQVPTWSESNGQDDIKWYEAAKQEDGSYVVNGNISDHGYGMGAYNFHAYVVDRNGYMGFVGSATAQYASKSSGVTVNADKANSKYTASISDVEIPGGVKSVIFAVWSDEGGQDDIKWYDASRSGNTYSASFNISDHQTAGIYHVHAYGRSATGSLVYLNENNDTNVAVSAKAAVSVENLNEEKGTFDVFVSVSEASSDILKVQVPVWSRADQSDIYWYTATKQADGRYKCTVYLYNHRFTSGTYNVHAYVRLDNGILVFGSGTTQAFNPKSYINVYGSSVNSTKTAVFKPAANCSSIRFAVWSEIGGQDDLKWYNASKQSDGTWTAVLNYADHKTEGTYDLHIYADNVCVAGTSFSFMSPDSFNIAYISIAAEIANDETHGYTLGAGEEDYSGDFDCSSFVAYCLKQSGYYPNADIPPSTREMRQALVNTGFDCMLFNYANYLTGRLELQPGDILLYENPGNYGHVEIYIGNGRTIGAHSDANYDPAPGDQTGLEISIYSFEESHSYNYILRDPNLASRL